MTIADELRKLQDLHRSGALTDEEFATAKAAVLAQGGDRAGPAQEPGLQEHLEEIKRQNEVARLDREWELERDRYMIAGQNGQRVVPGRGMSVVGGVVITVFGIFWTVMAASITGGLDGVFGCFPVFGVLFILFGLGMSIYSYTKANEYEAAYEAYQRRRAELLAGRQERTGRR